MTKIVLATNNKNKVKEVKEILIGTKWQVMSLADMAIDHEVEEDADTFEGNAMKKASEIMKLTSCTTIADDSGICVEALNGAPGVYSARFALDFVQPGQDINQANNHRLLSLLEGQENRNAKYVCAMAIAFTDGRIEIVTDECHGQIALSESGFGGFGYDPLFYLPEYNCTMASISSAEKHKISHRGKALRQLYNILQNSR